MDDLLDPGVKSSGGNMGDNGGTLPYSTAVLVLGIISIVGCLFYAIPGIVCGIIALSLHQKDKKMYTSDPDKYAVSFKNSKAGYICAIIGTSLSALYFIGLVVVLIGIAGARF